MCCYHLSSKELQDLKQPNGTYTKCCFIEFSSSLCAFFRDQNGYGYFYVRLYCTVFSSRRTIIQYSEEDLESEIVSMFDNAHDHSFPQVQTAMMLSVARYSTPCDCSSPPLFCTGRCRVALSCS